MCPSLRIRAQLPAPIVNGEGDNFWNGRISKFQGLVTLTVTLERVIMPTNVYHSSTSTYVPNFIKIEEAFADRRMDIFDQL